MAKFIDDMVNFNGRRNDISSANVIDIQRLALYEKADFKRIPLLP